MMKNTVITGGAVLALALILGACDQGLSVTSPDLTPLRDAAGHERGTQPSGLKPSLDFAYYGALNPASDPPQRLVLLTLPEPSGTELGLDLLDLEGEQFEAALKQQIFLTSLSGGNPETPGTPAAEEDLGYKLLRRDGAGLTLELSNLKAAARCILLRTGGDRYTYGGGTKFDLDRNGIAGEPLYDDFFRYYFSADGQNWGEVFDIDEAAGDEGWEDRIKNLLVPRRGISLEFSWLSYNKAAKTARLGIRDSRYPGESYNTILDKGVRFRKYNRTENRFEWVAPGDTTPFTNNEGSYTTDLRNIEPEDLLQVIFEDNPLGSLKTTGKYYGAEQRYYNWGIRTGEEISGAPKKLALVMGEPEYFTADYANSFAEDYAEKNCRSNFLTNPVEYAGPGGYHCRVVFDIDLEITGDQGLNPISGQAAFKESVKIASVRLGSSPLEPSVNWNELTFIGIEQAELRHKNPLAPSSSAPDQLVIWLDPQYRKGDAPEGQRYLLINSGYGYRGDALPGTSPGVFGDFRNIGLVLEGKTGFYPYGTGTSGF
jgi:hypothetical protein